MPRGSVLVHGQQDWRGCKRKKTTLPFLSDVIAENMRGTLGWVCDERPNAVREVMQHSFAWRKCWRRNMEAPNMHGGPTHRGRVWDKLAPERNGDQDRTEKRKHVCEQKKEHDRFRECEKRSKDSWPTSQNNLDKTVQMCGDSKVAEIWINGQKTHRDRIGVTLKTIHSWWQTRVAYPEQKSGDHVKHTERTTKRPTTGRTGEDVTQVTLNREVESDM